MTGNRNRVFLHAEPRPRLHPLGDRLVGGGSYGDLSQVRSAALEHAPVVDLIPVWASLVSANADREWWGRAMRVEAGKVVCVEYQLSLVDGTVIDSTEGSGLWTYVHGETKMPPGLSRGVEGLEVGEHARLELSPEDAFGAIDPAAFQDVPREMVPTSALRVGYTGELPGPGGTLIPFAIHAIHDTSVTLNLNHPLAGEHVVFEVWVRHIQD